MCDNPFHSPAIIYLRIIGNHTTRTVAQSPIHIRRGVQYEYVPILEMIFRIVLLKNAFGSCIIMTIAFKYLPQKCMVQVLLAELTWFYHTYISFSHGFTATKL